MTKSELIDALAEAFQQLPIRDIDFSVKTLLDAMVDNLASGKRIEIRGFGSFSLSQRSPRMGRNPKSGELVEVPGKKVPHFKAGKDLRLRVNEQFQRQLSEASAEQDADDELSEPKAQVH